MLVPAILYKEEIEKAFAKHLYTDEYFYYTGYANSGTLSNIILEDNLYQFAMINSNNEIIGYLSYRINPIGDTAYNFGLYSFDKGNPIVGKDLMSKMEELVNKYHRIEWRMIGGNPVKKHYDKFCKKHNGNVVMLHDVCKDDWGKYHDEYIYEIINKQ